MTMQRWTVTVARSETAVKEFIVEGEGLTKEQAEEQALEVARDTAFPRADDAEYVVQESRPSGSLTREEYEAAGGGVG